MEPILAGLRELESTLPYEPHPLLPGGPILNIGTISGGTKHNQVPDRCTVTLDIRLLPSQDPHDVKRQVEEMIEAAAHHGRLAHRCRGRVQRALAVGATAPVRDRCRRADRAGRSTMRCAPSPSSEPVYQGVPFWCDLVALRQFGVDGVNFGPGDPPYNFPDEYVSKPSTSRRSTCTSSLIREFCQ